MAQLSPEGLLNLIDTTWRQFSDIFVPLTTNQVDNIKRCSRLVATDPSTIHRNVPKLRARTILNDVLECSEELFFLCALSARPTQIGSLKSQDYLRGLMDWRKDKTCPKGLRYAITHYYALLPRKKATRERHRITPSPLNPILRQIRWCRLPHSSSRDRSRWFHEKLPRNA